MSQVIEPAEARPGAQEQIPIFSRTATGLVRQVSLLQQIVFNLASSNALGQGLVFFLVGRRAVPGARTSTSRC